MSDNNLDFMVKLYGGVDGVDPGPGVLNRLVEGVKKSIADITTDLPHVPVSDLRSAFHRLWSATASHNKKFDSWNRAHDTALDYRLSMMMPSGTTDQRLFHTQPATPNADAGFVAIRALAMFAAYHDKTLIHDSRELKVAAVKAWLRLIDDVPDVQPRLQATLAYTQMVEDRPSLATLHGLHNAAELHAILREHIPVAPPSVDFRKVATLAAAARISSPSAQARL